MAKLHFYFSAMNAGKSTSLLQSSHNYNERGMDTILYIPKIDTRSGEGVIGTRIGLHSTANIIDENTQLFDTTEKKISKNNNIKCILVDEAQFLNKKQVWELCLICDQLNLPVLAYGLRTDFQGETFEGSQYLLAWADQLIEIKTICHCGKKATMNLRIDHNGRAMDDGGQIQIGGNESYVATCRKHFTAKIANKNEEKRSQPIEN